MQLSSVRSSVIRVSRSQEFFFENLPSGEVQRSQFELNRRDSEK